MRYSDYVREKLREKQPDGISVGLDDINSTLFQFQRKIVCWALRKGHESIVCGRKFVGVELKPEYFRVAVKNLRKAELASGQESLFGEAL